VAGTAFLPWEKWLARLLHPIAVAIKEMAVSNAPKSVFRTKPRLATDARNGDGNKLGQLVSSGRNLVLLFNRTGLSIRLFLALV
jgi:hypothetical protein